MAESVKVIDPNSGAGYDYDSLYDGEAAYAGLANGDLVTLDRQVTFKCRCTGGTADTTAVTIDGWTTSATQYIKIWTDPSESYRHNGTYETGNHYRLEVTIAADGSIIDVEDNNVKFIGLQFTLSPSASLTYGSPLMFGLSSVVTGCIVDSCIFKSAASGTIDYANGIWCGSVGTSIVVVNSIFYDFVLGGVLACAIYQNSSGTIRVYNCTFHNCATTVTSASSNIYVINCIFDGSTSADVTSVTSTTYSATTRATLTGTGNRVNKSFSFVSASDFHLARNDTGALGYGLNLYNDANYPFQTDIDGNDRGGSGEPWSIGADHLDECVYVIDPDMGTGYDYDSLFDWEAARQAVLVIPEVAKCRCTAGTADTTSVVVDGWTTSATQYIKIWTDTSESYRHNGTYQTGNKYRIEISNAAAIVYKEQFVRFIGLQVYILTVNGTDRDAIQGQAIGDGYRLTVSHCILRGCNSAGTDSDYHSGLSIWDSEGITYFYNNLVYNFNSLADSVSNNAIQVYSAGGTTNCQYIYNCTFHNNSVDLELPLLSGANTSNIKNCIFSLALVSNLGAAAATYNLTNCATTAAAFTYSDSTTNCRLSQTFTFAGASDFHLASNDAGALGYGLNLYNDATYPFQTDIDGQDRGGAAASWDIGADEYVGAQFSFKKKVSQKTFLRL